MVQTTVPWSKLPHRIAKSPASIQNRHPRIATDHQVWQRVTRVDNRLTFPVACPFPSHRCPTLWKEDSQAAHLHTRDGSSNTPQWGELAAASPIQLGAQHSTGHSQVSPARTNHHQKHQRYPCPCEAAKARSAQQLTWAGVEGPQPYG